MFNFTTKGGRRAVQWLPSRSRKQLRNQSSSESSKATETIQPQVHVEPEAPSTSTSRLLHHLALPIRLYFTAQARRPYWTQFGTSIFIYFMGDLSSQYVRRPRAVPSQEPSSSSSTAPTPSFSTVYDPVRSLRNVIIGGIASIPSYRWFLFLGTCFNYPSSVLLSLGAKVITAQLCFTPIFNSYFFAMQSILSGLIPSKGMGEEGGEPAPTSILVDPSAALWEAGVRVRETVPTSWYNSCFFWPPVTALLYRFVPPQSRSATAGVVAVGWQTYLGLLNQRAVEKEAREAVVLQGST